MIKRMELTPEQRKKIDTFLLSQKGFTQDEYWSSYERWYKGGRGWWPLQQGGTGQMLALMWYQHRHKPKSREWRPKIIIEALLREVAEQ